VRVLFLCNKNAYLTKMSRVRFHSVEAIGRVCDLKWSGKNWKNYNNDLTVQENINNIYANEEKPDIVMAYKPLELKEFSEVEQTKCIRYNEMYDFNWTKKEIDESAADVVICHHLNDMKRYEKVYQDSDIKFINIPHSAEQTIFKDYGLEKQKDVLLVGSIFYESMLGEHYPLRIKMIEILRKMSIKYRCSIYPHPGGEYVDAYTNLYTKRFAHADQCKKSYQYYLLNDK